MVKNFGIAIALVVMFFGSTIAVVDGGSTPEIEARLNALEANVTFLKSENTYLRNLLVSVSRNGNNIIINGSNLIIRDGSGNTSGPVNGLGNLIIGYNEIRGDGNNRAGSHNLVLGSRNTTQAMEGWFQVIRMRYCQRMQRSAEGVETQRVVQDLQSAEGVETQPEVPVLLSAEE